MLCMIFILLIYWRHVLQLSILLFWRILHLPREVCGFVWWMEHSRVSSYVRLSDSGVQVLYNLADLLSSSSFLCESVVTLRPPIFMVEICSLPLILSFLMRCVLGIWCWVLYFYILYFSVESTIFIIFGLMSDFFWYCYIHFQFSYDYYLPGSAFPILSL